MFNKDFILFFFKLVRRYFVISLAIGFVCFPLEKTQNKHGQGVAASEVEVDCLTGDAKIVRADIIMDIGSSINPAIDIGQIEGAFVQASSLLLV